MAKITSHIPNTITCLNLVSGVAASVFALYGSMPIGALAAYQWAFVCIAAAAVFDFCDGAAARLFKAYSEMGKELDSLSDLVSFGVAPTLLVFATMCEYNGGFTPFALAAIAIAICGALRLAKFNIDDSQTTSFVGLPIPANAIFWIGTTAWIHDHTYPANWLMALIVIGFSLLMVCKLKMFSLKFANFDWRENFRRYVLIAAAVLFVATEGIPGLAWTIILYILISLLVKKD